MQGIDGLAEELPISQKGLCSKELVSKWFVGITNVIFYYNPGPHLITLLAHLLYLHIYCGQNIK